MDSRTQTTETVGAVLEAAMRRLLSSALVVAVAGAGCVHNPAIHPKENDKDITVADNGDLARGDEKLDEQDFYELVNDGASATEIEKSRAGGETFQLIGIPVTAAGVALGLGGLAYYLKLAQADGSEPAGDYDGYIAYGLLFGGIVVAGGGGYLVIDGREKASGNTRLFDTAHARASLEKGLYGGAGATAANIKSLQLTSADGNDTFCSITGAALKPVVAKDEKGRNVRLQGREDWIEYTSKPAGLVASGGGAVMSPWTESLAGLGNDVVVTATVKETGVTTSLTLKPDFACKSPGFSFGAGGGGSGNSGSWGSSGSSGAAGGDGGDGGPGNHGNDGVEVDVDVTTLPFKGKTLVVAALQQRGSKKVDLTVHDLSAGPLFVDVSGGPGGGGGSGGSGGSGGGGSGECMAGGDGGRGGRGGTGGNGGRGGEAHVRVDGDPKDLVSVSVAGGPGGYRGGGGNGGGGGSGTQCGDTRMQDGRRGPDGPDGQPGANGPSGKVDIKKDAKKNLTLLQKALSTAPK